MDQVIPRIYEYLSEKGYSNFSDFVKLENYVDLEQVKTYYTTLLDTLSTYFILIFEQIYSGKFIEAVELLQTTLTDFVDWINFTEFQLKLLREFSLILLGNLILVFIAWKIYGPRISAKFGDPRGSRRNIEELRLSVSELQLPTEHDFKFK